MKISIFRIFIVIFSFVSCESNKDKQKKFVSILNNNQFVEKVFACFDNKNPKKPNDKKMIVKLGLIQSYNKCRPLLSVGSEKGVQLSDTEKIMILNIMHSSIDIIEVYLSIADVIVQESKKRALITTLKAELNFLIPFLNGTLPAEVFRLLNARQQTQKELIDKL